MYSITWCKLSCKLNKANDYSLRGSLYFSQDNLSGKFLHLTRPHQVLPDWSVLI